MHSTTDQVKYAKGRLKILIGLFLNTLSQMSLRSTFLPYRIKLKTYLKM